MSETFSTLYKIDTSDNVRIWWMEQEGGNIRNHSGVQGGAIVTSGWKEMKAKNTGKKNATTPEEQGKVQIAAQYKKQVEQDGYYETLEAAKKGETTFTSPMLAQKYEDRKDEVVFPVWSDPKFDGIRAVTAKGDMKSRRGKPINSTPEILNDLAKVFELYPNVIFDGELYNHALKDDFNQIQSLVTKKHISVEEQEQINSLVEYHIYDIVELNNGLNVRNEFLHSIVNIIGPRIKIVDRRLANKQEELDDLYGGYLVDGYEGQMVRAFSSKYELKRTKSLLKRKEFVDEDFQISLIGEGQGNWAGHAKFVEFILPDDRRCGDGSRPKAGLRGNFDFARTLLEEAEEYAGGTVTVRFQNLTPDGIPRFAVATKFYKDVRDL
jgi:DNA ligase-1